MAERNQNEDSGQQQPTGQQNDNQFERQEKQPEGQQSQQPLGQQQSELQEREPSLGQQPNQQPGDGSGNFVGSESQDSGEYLQKSPDQGDIERGTERSQDRESDIEGSSDSNA